MQRKRHLGCCVDFWLGPSSIITRRSLVHADEAAGILSKGHFPLSSSVCVSWLHEHAPLPMAASRSQPPTHGRYAAVFDVPAPSTESSASGGAGGTASTRTWVMEGYAGYDDASVLVGQDGSCKSAYDDDCASGSGWVTGATPELAAVAAANCLPIGRDGHLQPCFTNSATVAGAYDDPGSSGLVTTRMPEPASSCSGGGGSASVYDCADAFASMSTAPSSANGSGHATSGGNESKAEREQDSLNSIGGVSLGTIRELMKVPARPWNEQFQTLLDQLANTRYFARGADEAKDHEKEAKHDGAGDDDVAVVAQLHSLVQDFQRVACCLGRVIIAQQDLPVHQQPIPPAEGVGGVAGGEKVRVCACGAPVAANQ